MQQLVFSMAPAFRLLGGVPVGGSDVLWNKPVLVSLAFQAFADGRRPVDVGLANKLAACLDVDAAVWHALQIAHDRHGR